MDIEKSGQSEFDAEAIVKEVYGNIPSRVKISDGEIRFKYLYETELALLIGIILATCIPPAIGLGIGLFDNLIYIYLLLVSPLYFYLIYAFILMHKSSLILTRDGIRFEKRNNSLNINTWKSISRITVEDSFNSPMKIEFGDGTFAKLPNYLHVISPSTSVNNDQLYTLISRCSGGLVPVIKALPSKSKIRKAILFAVALGIASITGLVLVILLARGSGSSFFVIILAACLVGFIGSIVAFAWNVSKMLKHRAENTSEVMVLTVGNTNLRSDWTSLGLSRPAYKHTYVYSDKAKRSLDFKDFSALMSMFLSHLTIVGAPIALQFIEKNGLIPVGATKLGTAIVTLMVMLVTLFFATRYILTFMKLKRNLSSKLIFDVDGVYVERKGKSEPIVPGSLEYEDATVDGIISPYKAILKVKVGKEKLLFDTLQMVSISNQELLNNLPDELTKL